jgi:parallel beta-helix repeat protein
MKKNLLIYSFLSLFFFLTISSNVNAQIKDTTTFDYDAYTGCDACGDKISYLPQSKDSISDVPKSGLYINSIRVKVKLFTCYTGDLYLYINGQKAATSTINSNCSCNACDSISFVLSTADVRAFYKINQKNIIEVKSYNSNDLYLDRVIFIREYEKRYNFDAGILSIDSPSVFVCPGAKNIKVKIYNNGKKQFSALNLDWKWNGVSQTSVSYSSSTLDTFNGSGSNTALVSLGSKTFTKAKQDTLIVWTRNPGGVADSANFNDTMFYVFNGSYGDTITVGGTSPMFSTIQSAIDELMSFGVCSPTYVKIRPGTYNEQLYIGNIPGTSAANTVTFLSSNNDSSSVIINYSANSSDNYTVQLEDVSNIKFHRLTFEALNTSYGRVFYLRRSLENIYFSNCAINGISTTSTSTSRAAIYRENGSNSDKTQNINFNRTQINNGSYGMYFDNPYYTIGNGFYISNCVFNNQYYANLQYQYGQNIGISNSTFIRNSSSYEYGGGVRFNYIDDSLIFANNNVLQNNGGYGFYLYSSYAPDSKRFLIANNFISVNTSLDYSDDNALYLQSVENADVIFNSVYRQTENSNNSALVISDGYNNQLLNNNIYNDNKGKVFRISGSSTTMKKSDRNNFYNNGGDLGNWLNNSISTIDELASIVKMDSNSVSTDPNLMSSTNGHAYNVFLDGGASPFSGITKDLDGENRNATTPDIGADEFRLIGVDAGLVGFVKPKVGTSCASVVLRNYGTTTLTSVKIDWKHNGTAKSQVSWTGSLAKGRDTIVCLGNITFAKDTLYKFLAWTSAPNSATDSIPMNDSTYDELYPAMRGEYTIGGTSPDFSTFADAVAAVEKAGVIDSVLFKVRNGTYTEQIEINEIEGASAKNSVIFQSESKDSTKVTLEYYSSSGSNDNYVVYLNRARGITFRKMTLQNGSTDYQTVVKINNGSKNISFENNIIQCEDSISTYYEFSLVLSENNEGKEVDFVRNVFNRGSYGLFIQGNSSSFENGVLIQNNTFNSQSYLPVSLTNLSNTEFSNNSITSSGNSVYIGLRLSSFRGSVKIFNNKINVNGNSLNRGVVLEGNNDFDTVQFYNNFIYTSGTTSAMSLYCYDLQNANIYYNNILNECLDSSGSSTAFYYAYGNYRIMNNNFVHLKNGYAVYRDYVYSVLSNNNNLYSSGTKYIYWEGSSYGNLADFSSAELQDTNSVEVDPIFTSSDDLHVSFVGINAKAKPIAGITKDIDGQTRNTSTPDIGADEFNPANLDVSVLKLLSPNSLYKADTLDVDLILINLGLDTIKKVTAQIKINNDTLTRKIFNRTFASGDTVHVRLGSYIFKKDSVYNFTAWSSLPNGSADQKSSNDTLQINNTTPAMSGVYTIGGTTPDFTTFTAAINALKSKGIIDSVRFRVRSGTYYEQLTIPHINGSANRNSIIFESQSFDSTAVVLEYGSSLYDSNYVVQLNGADGVTFRYMTISATSSSNYNHVFDIRGGAKNNTIYKNIIEGTNTTNSTSDNALIFSGQDTDDNLWIKDNHFKNGDYAMYLYGYSSYGYEKNLEVSGNKILNPYYMGIYLYYSDSASILNNYIYADKYYYFYGMQLQYNPNKLKVERNVLDLRQGYYGIYIYNCGNSYKRSLVANNAVYLKNPSNYSYGIYAYYPYYTDFLHNSINIDNPYTSSRSFSIYYGGNNKVYNNIFVNKGTGYAYSFYSSSNSLSNTNDMYSLGTSVGYYNGSNISNLSSWKSTTAMDSNSISIDPIFKSASDLHAKEISLNGKAKYFNTVPLDFEGQIRDTLKPDIGADEFDLPQNDAGILTLLPFATDSQFVKVAMKNHGGNTITSATIGWTFNNVSQTAISWSGSVASGDTVHVKLSKKYFKRDTAYDFKIWTLNPNGVTDPTPENDTLEVVDEYPAMNGEIYYWWNNA